MTPGTGPGAGAPAGGRGGGPTDPSDDVAAIHRLRTITGDPQQQLVAHLELGLQLLSVGGGLVGRVAGRGVSVEAFAGALPPELGLTPGAGLPTDARITAVLQQRATVAWLEGRGTEPAELALGPGAVLGTPVWIAGEIVGVLAFLDPQEPAGAFTPWQFAVVELLADGVSRVLDVGAEVDARARSDATIRALLGLIPDRLYRLTGTATWSPGRPAVRSPAGRPARPHRPMPVSTPSCCRVWSPSPGQR